MCAERYLAKHTRMYGSEAMEIVAGVRNKSEAAAALDCEWQLLVEWN